eukprot:14823033-Alexandrium_andersonii.AAC.1
MSASLVGSEMCIRDRCSPMRTPWLGGSTMRLALGASGTGQPWPAPRSLQRFGSACAVSTINCWTFGRVRRPLRTSWIRWR